MRTAGSKNRSTPARRREILDGALALFLEQGIVGATLDAICARLAVTKGSVYHHFASKEEIAVQLYRETVESLHAQVQAALVGVADARTACERLIRAYLDWHEHNADRALFMIRIMDGHLLSAHVEPVRQSQRDFVEQTAAWLAPFARAGVVRKLPARLYAALVVGPSRDFLRIWLTDRDPALIKTAGKVFPAAAWRSIASDDAA